MRSVSVSLDLVSNWLQSHRALQVVASACLSGFLQATVIFQRRHLQQLSDCITTNPRHSEITHAVNTLTYIREVSGSILVWDTNFVDILSALSEALQSNTGNMTQLKSQPLPLPPVTN